MPKTNRGGKRGAGGSDTTNPAVEKTLDKIIKRTANLKKEQYRIVDENGNVVLEAQGKAHEVATTVGQKREFMPNAVSIHNHPAGGTFSDADFDDFGYGAKEIVVATPEGTYRLKNTKFGTKDQYNGWVDLRDDYRKFQDNINENSSFRDRINKINEHMDKTPVGKEMNKISDTWMKRKKEGASEAELKGYVEKHEKLSEKYKAEKKAYERKLEVKPYHDFLKKNAKKYGFKYSYPKAAD